MAGVPEEQQCVFCAIAAGKIPSKVVYEDDKVTAVLDINPAARGHTLLIPKEHIQIMPQMDDALSGHVGLIAKQLSGAILRAEQADGITIFVANGAAAGQRAPHFMLHMIPRKDGDDLGLKLSATKLDAKTMKAVFDKLAPAVAKQFGVEVPKVEGDRKETSAPKDIQDTNKEQTKSEEPSTKKDKSSLDSISNMLTGGK